MEATDEPINEHGFTVKQQRFIEEFCVDGNQTQAALRAGYAESGAAVEGHRLLRNAKVFGAIEARMADLSMGAAEVVKRISNHARTRLNDYLKIEKRQRVPQVPQSLHDAIAETQNKLWFEEEFLRRSVSLLGYNEEQKAEAESEFEKKVGNPLKLQILRWQMELEEVPEAFRLIAGEPEEYEAVEVDMVGLARAKEQGNIKTLSFNEYGPKVEMYAADGALRDIGRVHGIFEKDNRQLAGTDVEINIGGSPSPAQEAQD